MTGIECVAQLVEHLTFNQVAEGSNPSALTNQDKGSRVLRTLHFFSGAHLVHYFFQKCLLG